jgi:prepilin-type processing-associated H-X9-DG protein
VVITIIGILIALLLPAVQAAREAARRMQCSNNFKQVGLALHNYHTTVGCFPPGMFRPEGQGKYANVPYYFGWGAYLLPYMEQQSLYDQYTFNQPAAVNMDASGVPGKNGAITATKLSCYLCPSDPTSGEGSWVSPGLNPTPTPQCGMTDICAVSDSTQYYDSDGYPQNYPINDGIFGANQSCRMADIKDGASNTFMIGEVAGAGTGVYASRVWGTWDIGDMGDGINGITTVPGGATPTATASNGYVTRCGFSSYHAGGANFGLADGSATFISQNTANAILKALTTRDGMSLRNYKTPETEILISGAP